MTSLTSKAEVDRKCLASGQGYEPSEKPPYRVQLQLKCPGSLQGKCGETEQVWYCTLCSNPIEVIDNDDYFYCSCGKAKRDTFSFNCTSDQHGYQYIPAGEMSKHLKPNRELNILVIGTYEDETPTWINSFINYIAYPSLEQAAKEELFSALSFSFHIIDKNDGVQNVKFETQNVKTNTGTIGVHCFAMGSTLIRLIDIPGTRSAIDVENMKKQFQKTLAYLRGLKELHGICVLLKPDEPKFDKHFELCFKELMNHFYWTIIKNISFCFTRSGGSPHQVAAMRVSLGKLVKESKLDIALDKSRLFRMDNGALRFLCARKQGVQFEKSSEQESVLSWSASVRETKRLISHFQSTKPHDIEETMSWIDARKNVVVLTKPIADVLEYIQHDLHRYSGYLTNGYFSASLLCPVYSLTAKPLNHFQTRCANENCSKKSSGSICHSNCCLEDIPLGIVGKQMLRNCWAMENAESLYCCVCSCFWRQHQVINYTLELKHVAGSVVTFRNTIIELEEEQQAIIKCSVKIGHYLSKQAFVSYNNVMMSYIDHAMISAEKNGDNGLLTRFAALRDKYFKEYKLLKKAMGKSNAKEFGSGEFEETLKELCAMKHYGKVLKILFQPVLNRKEEKCEVDQWFHDLTKESLCK